ncbi:MAG: NUDIX domain-containing protein [Patescibacteria group bacterium]
MLRKIFYPLINRATRIIFPLAVAWWKLTKPKTFGVKVVIGNDEDKVLLIKVTYIPNAAWTFPGGKIEKGELATTAAIRESFEEVGIKLASVVKIGEYFSTKWGKRDTVSVLAGKINHSNFKIDPFEIKEAKWFKLDELPPLPTNNNRVLEMYRAYIKAKRADVTLTN